MQYRVDLSNIVWDTDGVSPTECGLPLSLDFFVEAPAGLIRSWDLHPEILHYLHDRYNFNVVDFTVRSARTGRLVLPAPREHMDPDVLRGMEWGSHPQHGEAVQQVGRQIRGLPIEPNASIDGSLTLRSGEGVTLQRNGETVTVNIELNSEDLVRAAATPIEGLTIEGETAQQVLRRAGLQQMMQEAAAHYGPGAVAANRGELMRGTPPAGGPPWVTNPNAARAEQYRASGQSQRRRPATGDPVVDAEMSEFHRFIESAGIPAGDAVELLEAQLRSITERQRAERQAGIAEATQAPPPAQPAPSAARSAFQRAVDAFGAAAIGAVGPVVATPGVIGPSQTGVSVSSTGAQQMQNIARVGPWANLASASVGQVVQFFSQLFNVFTVTAVPCCPVCDSPSAEFTCTISLNDKSQQVYVVCGVCDLKTVPLENAFRLQYGDKSITAEYSCLKGPPGGAFIRFVEEIFLWRATHRNGGKKKSRQSVILNPAEEEADENPVRDSV